MPLNHLIWQHFFLFMLEGDVMTQHSYSESEWGDRLKLAALYRLMAIH